MISDNPPPQSHIELQEIISNRVYNDYFFLRLNRVDWLPFLLNNKFYTQSDIEAYPYRLAYLHNIADLAPNDVVDALEHISFSDVSIQSLFLQILQKLPTAQKRALLPKIEAWELNKESYSVHQLQEFAQLMLRDPEPQGLDRYLTEYLLYPQINVQSNYYIFEAKLDNWHYSQFIKENINILSNKEWYIGVLFNLLGAFSKIEQQKGISHYTSILRSPLGRSERFLRDEPFQIILNATLNELKKDVTSSVFENVWQQLQVRPDSLFTRMRLLFLAYQVTPPLRSIKEALLDRFAFENFIEYREAAKAHFSKLDPPAQQTIWSWVTKPLPSDPIPSDGDDTFAQERKTRAIWKKLETLNPHLPPDLLALWNPLKERYGEHRDEGPTVRFREGTSSSITADMLSTKSILDVIELLKGEAPSTGDEWFDRPESRVAGLADVIRQDAIRRASEYFSHVELLQTISPVYLLPILNAYRSDEVSGRVPWVPFLQIFKYVCDQSQQHPDERNWTFCVGSMADSLEIIIQKEQHLDDIFKYAQQIASTLEKALLDPDPLADLEIENLEGYGDAYTRSLNVTRGKVIHALIRFIGELQNRVANGNGSQLYEVLIQCQTAILHHLQVREVSSAVFAAVVPTLPWFDYHNSEYAKTLINLLFDRSAPRQSSASWSTHLHWNRYYSRMFELLRQSYAVYAQDDLGSESPLWKTNDSTQQEFAEHVGMFYVRGIIQFNQPDRILENLLFKGSETAIASIFSLTGQALERTEGNVDTYVTSLKKLWEVVNDEYLPKRSEEDQQEIRASFVWLLKSSHFDITWRLNQLSKIASLPRKAEGDFVLLKTLTELPDADNRSVLKIVAQLAEVQPMDGMAARHVKTLLDRVAEDQSADVTYWVNIIVNQNVARGYIGDFRALYRKSPDR